jgi:hypothetical protein
MNAGSDYNVRSLQHERRMLELYRQGAAGDGALLQPLANACWRAAAFEWRLHEDVPAVRSLWEEAARALAEGFVRRRAGFEPTSEQLILGLHFAIAAQAVDAAKSLAYAVAKPSTPMMTRSPRVSLRLLEGYQLVVRALLEHDCEHARAAQQRLAESRVDSDSNTRPCATVREAVIEHETIRNLLTVIALVLETGDSATDGRSGTDWPVAKRRFGSLMDAALLYLNQCSETEMNHRPKQYCWLPGIALSILAAGAGLPLDWLDHPTASTKDRYSRLPFKLVQPAHTDSAGASCS